MDNTIIGDVLLDFSTAFDVIDHVVIEKTRMQ
jgi:hypothetical protein